MGSAKSSVAIRKLANLPKGFSFIKSYFEISSKSSLFLDQLLYLVTDFEQVSAEGHVVQWQASKV